MTGFSILDVIDKGFCVGCGACAAVAPTIGMRLTDLGTFLPDLTGAPAPDVATADAVCPFSDTSPDETRLGQQRFSGVAKRFDPRIGHYTLLGAGAITDETSREASSSGGMTSHLLHRLLDKGMVDGIIHVSSSGASSEGLFSYTITRATGPLDATRKSKYYAAHMAEVLRSVRGDGLRYAFTGVPCFVTAARHLAEQDPEYGRQIVYFVGLVCGHLKSTRFAELMAWQLDIPPDDLAEVDFRKKMPGLPANQYHFAARPSAGGSWRSAVAGQLYGGDWGYAFFQLKACDYCDDIFAEAADIAFGDAWLPRYEKDWLGTNVVVSRRPELDDLIAEGRRTGTLQWEEVSADDLCRSQAGNFRHRRDGLSLRLQDARAAGEAVPTKRVAPGSIRLSYFRRRIVRLRRQTAATSHTAFAKARQARDLAVFMAEMEALTDKVKRVYRLMRLATVRGVAGAVLRRLGVNMPIR